MQAGGCCGDGVHQAASRHTYDGFVQGGNNGSVAVRSVVAPRRARGVIAVIGLSRHRRGTAIVAVWWNTGWRRASQALKGFEVSGHARRR